MKTFCPNCEADTPCTHEAELYVCEICGEDFAKYIVSRNCSVSDVSMTQDVSTDIKTPQSIENTNPDYYKQELARRDEKIAELLKVYGECKDAIARRDEVIRKLKEDGERLFSGLKDFDGTRGWKICKFCHAEMEFVDHASDCPITLHRALMKELE